MTARLALRIAGAALIAILAMPVAAGATLPGKNGVIAFDNGNGVIYTIRANGKGLKRITEGYGPSYSHNGRNLLFTFSPGYDADDNPISQLFRASANGQGRTMLVPGPFAGGGAWSPDSKRIAYLDGPLGDGGSDLWVMNADGSDRRRIAADMEAAQWSSKNQIAFSPGKSGVGIGVMRPDGTGKKMLTRRYDDYAPNWSPDGRRLAFIREYSGNMEGGIYVMRSNGKGLRRIFTDNRKTETTDVGAPVWSPDGRWILFIRQIETREGEVHSQLYVMRPDGKGRRRVSRRQASSPDWQPLR